LKGAGLTSSGVDVVGINGENVQFIINVWVL